MKTQAKHSLNAITVQSKNCPLDMTTSGINGFQQGVFRLTMCRYRGR